MTDTSQSAFDFDGWAMLARRDPEAFERRRAEALAAVIEEAPEPIRGRLTGLQWQIDRTREQTKTPLAACLRISDLMWERVLGNGGLVDALNCLADATGPKPFAARPSAEVVSLAKHHTAAPETRPTD